MYLQFQYLKILTLLLEGVKFVSHNEMYLVSGVTM